MNLQPAPNDVDNLYLHVLESETGLIRMAVHPVLYGWRVRAWFVDAGSVALDWCAGSVITDVERLYSLLRNILLQRPEDRKAFSKLPTASAVKPFFLDEKFLVTVLEAAADPITIINFPDLREETKAITTPAIDKLSVQPPAEEPQH